MDSQGNPIGGLGDLLCRYTYDGLGRLIRKETPVNAGSTYLQHKDLYYDGVRRIEEVIFRPTVTPDGIDTEGTAFVTDGDVENDELKLERSDGSDPTQAVTETLGGEIGPQGETYVDREYVYGPEYVDEFVLQIDRTEDLTMYMLQDANYNVVALTADAGFLGRGTTPLPVGSMLEQYVYEPYGEVAIAESLGIHADNRVGHQGLFFERYDGTYTGKTLCGGTQQIDSGLYYNRNRFYNPTLGRFIQRDPNETALPIITALAKNGESLSALVSSFSGTSLYGDGMNLYEYEGSNPVNYRDASGLMFQESSNVFDDLDGVIFGMQAEKAAWADAAFQFGMGVMRAASIFALESAVTAVVPGAGFALAVYGAGTSISDILTNGIDWGNGLSLVANLAGVRAGAKAAIGQFRAHYAKFRTKYGGRARAGRRVGGMGCFVAGTLVIMSDGALKPIEEIRSGDLVLCAPEPGNPEYVESQAVTRTSERPACSLVCVTLETGGGEQVISATPDHPFYAVHTQRFVPAAHLESGATLQGVGGDEVFIESLTYSRTEVMVYNLEVSSAHNYFVAAPGCDVAVLVHNGACPRTYYAEKDLYGSGKHGIGWEEAESRAIKDGKPQGKFGCKADVDYMVDVAKAENFDVGVHRIPARPGTLNTVTYPDRSTVMANNILVIVKPSGRIHAYPIP